MRLYPYPTFRPGSGPSLAEVLSSGPVGDPRLLDLNIDQLHIYRTFKEPQTVKDASAVLDMPAQTVTGFMSRMITIGLIRQCGIRKVGRRTHNVYEAV